jgi:hypothetical protein
MFCALGASNVQIQARPFIRNPLRIATIRLRFTGDRKVVLDALREELRKRDYLPILFDFEVLERRNFTETQTGDTQTHKTISGSSTRTAVAACRRTTKRPRASSSSPQTRDTQPGRTISGSSTGTAVAACRRTTKRPRASSSSPQTRDTQTHKTISGSRNSARPTRPPG